MSKLMEQVAMKNENFVWGSVCVCGGGGGGGCFQTDGEVRLKPCKRLAGSWLAPCQPALGAERDTASEMSFTTTSEFIY